MMKGESINIQHEQLEKMKQLFPEAFTEEKIDWEKLQATLGKENIEFRNERYVLNWAGKSEAFKAGYKTIADISKERIRRVIKKLEKEAEELKKKKAGELPLTESNSTQPVAGRLLPVAGFKVFKLSPSSFKIWRGKDITEENLVNQLDAFTDPVRGKRKREHALRIDTQIRLFTD